MADFAHGRLDKLARLYGLTSAARKTAEEALRAVHAELLELERTQQLGAWPAGTADAILRALMAGGSHVVTSYDADGTRTVARFGPWYTKTSGEINWACPLQHTVLEQQTSYADGLEVTGLVSTRLPNGEWWDARRRPAPSAQQLRQMVVDQALVRDELALLDAAVRDSGGWAAWLVAGAITTAAQEGDGP